MTKKAAIEHLRLANKERFSTDKQGVRRCIGHLIHAHFGGSIESGADITASQVGAFYEAIKDLDDHKKGLAKYPYYLGLGLRADEPLERCEMSPGEASIESNMTDAELKRELQREEGDIYADIREEISLVSRLVIFARAKRAARLDFGKGWDKLDRREQTDMAFQKLGHYQKKFPVTFIRHVSSRDPI